MLCDFGCARLINLSRSFGTVTSTAGGTNSHWAPELIQWKKDSPDSKETDVWAFGMTVYVSYSRLFVYSPLIRGPRGTIQASKTLSRTEKRCSDYFFANTC